MQTTARALDGCKDVKVMLVKMSSLGDVIHTLPALSDAYSAIPGIRFDWVVEEAFAEIPRWHAAVDRVVPVALRRWRTKPLQFLSGGHWRALREVLKEKPYDLAIDAQGLIKSAIITAQIQAPGAGFARSSAREPLAALAYQQRFIVPKQQHAIARSRALFAAALGYRLPSTAPDFGIGNPLTVGAMESEPSLVFCHASARDEKLWPEAYWVELACKAVLAGHRIDLPWGNQTESLRAMRIRDAVIEAVCEAGSATASVIRVLPRSTLSQMAEHFRRAQAAVAVDTGLGHLAAAVDCPMVSLYGPTDPSRIGALGQHQLYALAPSQDMADIPVAVVWEKLSELLSNRSGNPVSEVVGASHV